MREVKKALRRKLIARRKALSAEEKRIADESIFRQLVPYIKQSDAVFCYASTEIEVDTRRLIDFCLEEKVPVALPVSGDTELSFYYIESASELHKGRYDIDEPPTRRPAVFSEKTLCIVPALCADGNGFRLGYGKGYYDRFLNIFSGVSVIVCYKSFKQEVPSEPHDMRAKFTVFDE